jgi:hypothetical protein
MEIIKFLRKITNEHKLINELDLDESTFYEKMYKLICNKSIDYTIIISNLSKRYNEISLNNNYVNNQSDDDYYRNFRNHEDDYYDLSDDYPSDDDHSDLSDDDKFCPETGRKIDKQWSKYKKELKEHNFLVRLGLI